MATATLKAGATAGSGLRPIDFSRDLGQVADLIELCFSHELARHGRGAVSEMRMMARLGPLAGALHRTMQWQGSSMWSDGFVWLDDGKLVGNISLQRSDTRPDVWLVANVAVHPDFRRRGLARQLTAAGLDFARQRGGRRAQLQVDGANYGAHDLYYGLGFVLDSSRTTWERARASNVPNALPVEGVELRPLREGEWRAAYHLLEQVLPEGLEWTRPLRERDYRPSLWLSIDNALQGRKEENWGAFDLHSGALLGFVRMLTMYGSLTRFSVVLDPRWRATLFEPLLVRALRRLGRVPWGVRLDYPTFEQTEVLERYGFRTIRTLLWMSHDLRL